MKRSSSKLTDATLIFFNFVPKKLPPTSLKSHYIFNFRDLSRIYKGVCFVTQQKVKNSNDIRRLWQHKLHNIICNRLATNDDLILISKELKYTVKDTLPNNTAFSLSTLEIICNKNLKQLHCFNCLDYAVLELI